MKSESLRAANHELDRQRSPRLQLREGSLVAMVAVTKTMIDVQLGSSWEMMHFRCRLHNQMSARQQPVLPLQLRCPTISAAVGC